jgi:probable HAF family extracellular repeat protein
MHSARRQSGALAVAIAVAGSIVAPLGAGVAAAAPAPITVINLGNLGQPGAAASQQIAINSAGRVVGSLFVNSGGSRAFSWTESTGMVDLGTSSVFSDPSSLGAAIDVNDAGEVAGNVSATQPSRVASAFTWTAAGGLDFGDTATAVAINNAGQVIGTETPASGPSGAVIWTPGHVVAGLGSLGGTSGADAVAINDSGQVVGLSNNASHETDAFSWTATGGMVDLGNLGGGSSEATAVSNDGMVVGFGYASGFPTNVHAFAWTSASA